MFRRTVSLAVALLGAVGASQLPEFTQQYSQRLGGAIDELTRIVKRFDADSVAVNESRQGALARLAQSPDELARRQSAAMAANIGRLGTLQAQQAEMAEAGQLGRIQAFVADPDPDVVAATWKAFQPGVPTTGEAAIVGGAGFLAGGGIASLIGRLFRRRPSGVALR
jgi:Protein of unknown function (DUF2937)